MNRRTIIFGLAGISGISAAGYTSWTYLTESNTDSKGETVHIRRDVFTDGRHDGGFDWKEKYHAVISDEATAKAVLSENDPIGSFVENTDFADSFLVIVQTGVQSSAALVLDTTEWVDNRLHVDVDVTYPRDGGDDLVTHSLLIRITDEEVPEKVTVQIEGYI